MHYERERTKRKRMGRKASSGKTKKGVRMNCVASLLYLVMCRLCNNKANTAPVHTAQGVEDDGTLSHLTRIGYAYNFFAKKMVWEGGGTVVIIGQAG